MPATDCPRGPKVARTVGGGRETGLASGTAPAPAFTIQIPDMQALGIMDILADMVQVESLPETRINPRRSTTGRACARWRAVRRRQ